MDEIFAQTDWFTALKPYQLSSIRTLIDIHGEEKAAEIWLTSQGSDSIIPFGAASDPKPFWGKFKDEFKKLICIDEEYKLEKEQIKKIITENGLTTTLVATAIASAIGAAIGIAASILVPVVIIMLTLIGKMGRNAYCST